jgi:hypothetical protein
MRKYKAIVPLLLVIVWSFIMYFIDVNVKNFDLRFYDGKDNGLFSYFEVSILTIVFIYIDLFRNFFLALIIGLFYGVISFVLIYLLFNTDDLIRIFILHLIFSLLPIFIAAVIKNGSYLDLKFKVYNILGLVAYLLFLEVILRFSMESSIIEFINW